jgi:IMP dehydrogenase
MPEGEHMAEIEIGIFKSGRQAYGLDDIAIVPSRRTRDPEDVDISWEIDAYRFDLPLLGSAMDGVISPATAIELGKLGGLGVLNLEGLWTRYEDPTNLFDEIRELDDEKATARMQQMYSEPIIPELVTARIRQMKEAGITTAASVTPQRTESLAPACLAAELDILVIQGTVVSAEHVSKSSEPLNLKRFIREFDLPVIVGGCASYQAGLHLMRTGAVGVLVGVGPGNACTTRPRGPAGHGHRRRRRGPDAPSRRDRGLRPRHRRRRNVQGWRHRQGDRLRRRRRHARVAAVLRLRSAGARLSLGDGYVPPDPAPRGPGAHVGAREPPRNPARPRP